MSSDRLSELTVNWGPTRTSTVLSLLTVVGTILAVLWHIDSIVVPAAASCLASLTFAVGLWIASIDYYKPITATAVSLFIVPVSAGTLAAIVGGILLVSQLLFPVSGRALVSTAVLILIGHVGVVIGISLAVFGSLLGLQNVGSEANFRRFSRIGVKTGLIPITAAGIFITTSALLTPSQRGQFVRSLDQIIQRGVFAQGIPGAGLSSFFALVALTGLTVSLAIRSLPFAEFLSDTGSGPTYHKSLNGIVLFCVIVGSIAASLSVLSFIIVSTRSPERLAMQLGSTVYVPLSNITSSTALRRLMVGVFAVAGAALSSSRFLRRLSQNSLSDGLHRWLPVIIGGLLAGFATGFAGSLYDRLVDFTVQLAPVSFRVPIQQSATALADRFGTPSVILTLLASLIGLSVAFSVVFLFTIRLGYFSEESSGNSLASAGVFIMTVFAGTIGAPELLVFAGVISSLFILDVGRFGTTLGTEIGRHPQTWQTELVHAGGTLLVGLLAVGTAVTASSIIQGLSLPEPATTTVALLFVVLGTVSLVVALR